MRKLLTLLICSIVFFGNYAAHAQDLAEVENTFYDSADSLAADSIEGEDVVTDLPWPQSLQANLDSIIAKASLLKTAQMGLYVYDLTTDSVLYAYNEKQTLRPASTMKLITAITALDRLGGDYQYKTRLCYTGKISSDTIYARNDSTRYSLRSTLHGDLYLIGGMDPKIGNDDIRAFAISVKELGIDTIRGNIYADRSMKDDKMFGEGWCWDDKNPELSALVFNRKDALMDKFLQALSNAGITVIGEQRNRTCPSGAKELCVRTHTIDQIMQKMLKDSDNMYAESMLYQIGLTQGKPSTAKKARIPEEAILKKMGLANAPHRFADGSGLSLYNYVSAEIEVAFLRYAYADANIYGHLRSHLPIAGVDGTLDERMIKTPAQGNVHAKTGTVSGISSLAGYCTAPNGHEIAFAIINQGQQKSAPAKALQNRICVALCK